jgi:DNA-binding PadR family transcriptional regulator
MLLRYALLALLRDRELHGYAVKAAFEKRVGPFWVLNFGQIYQGLKHLRGEVSLPLGSIPERAPGTLVYTVTPKGRNALSTWLALASPPAAHPR